MNLTERLRKEEAFLMKGDTRDDTTYRSPEILEEGRRNSYYSAVPTVPDYEQRPVHLRHMSGGAGKGGVRGYAQPLGTGQDPQRVPLSPGRPF